MNRRHPQRPGIVRLLAVCAVLLGLFLMHGLPTAAAEGCHTDGAAATAAMPGTTMSDPPTGNEAVAPAGVHPAVHHGSDVRSAGTLCSSTPGRDRIALPAMALIAIVSVWGGLWQLPLRVTGFLARRRRGPPDGGRELLQKVCIART
ncbi:DUF6153 family protein [Kitasatospora cathayae]|uniref:DUF6153 family protein n=1 Tax=Kitasatospora cathayae TaxID=3004092 RepID=A0ABY7PY23_9ACTN|nr:DUF6153 family protein [Kitasatospora sp. HUAS 3-15]WBP85104.1 DUF6153 family protein [Kitasatospora sp. HUAS 3-15]